MYELYIGNKNYSSWSLRPWVLMRALAIPFVEHVVSFDPGTSWAKFRAFSPSGKVPCLVDGDDRGLGFHGHRRVPRGAPCGGLAA